MVERYTHMHEIEKDTQRERQLDKEVESHA